MIDGANELAGGVEGSPISQDLEALGSEGELLEHLRSVL